MDSHLYRGGRHGNTMIETQIDIKLLCGFSSRRTTSGGAEGRLFWICPSLRWWKCGTVLEFKLSHHIGNDFFKICLGFETLYSSLKTMK